MKNTNKLLILFFLFASFALFAENEGHLKKHKSSSVAEQSISIKGRVVDVNNREGLAGAEITVEPYKVKTFTDLEGNFEIAGLTPGQYTLICSLISYRASLLENLEISPETNKIEIALEEIK